MRHLPLGRTGCSEKRPSTPWVEFSPSPGGDDSQQDVLQGCHGSSWVEKSSQNSRSEQHLTDQGGTCNGRAEQKAMWDAVTSPAHLTAPHQGNLILLSCFTCLCDVFHHNNVRKKRSIHVKQEIVHTDRALPRRSQSLATHLQKHGTGFGCRSSHRA